jgi:hypothetical protein
MKRQTRLLCKVDRTKKGPEVMILPALLIRRYPAEAPENLNDFLVKNYTIAGSDSNSIILAGAVIPDQAFFLANSVM